MCQQTWVKLRNSKISATKGHSLTQLVLLENNISCFSLTATCFDRNDSLSDSHKNYSLNRSLIQSLVYLMTRPQPLPKRLLHKVRSSASSFNFHCPLVSFRSSSTHLRLLPVTSIPPSTFPSIMCFKRQFLRNPIRLPYFTVCRIILSSFTLCNTSTILT